VVEDDVDVAAQLANVPDAASVAESSSVTDSSPRNGRGVSAAEVVLDPGLAVAAEPAEAAPSRSSSRSRRARQRSAAATAAVATATVVEPDPVVDEDVHTDDMHTEVLPVVEESSTETEPDTADADVLVEDVHTEDAVVEDELADDRAESETETDADVLVEDALAEDRVDTTDTDTTDTEPDDADVLAEDAAVETDTDTTDSVEADTSDPGDALLDTEALPVVEPEPLAHTEVLPVVDDRSAPESLVETEILPEVEPRIYDVETDEPGAYVSLVPAVTEPAPLPAHVEDEPQAPVVVRRRRRRPRVRRVTRVIRHIDTWTVFKVVLLFNIVLYAATLISGVLLWNVAHGTGTVGNVERFMESFGWETFEFNGQEIFDNGWRLGMFVALGLTGLAVLAATTFNLITDIVGGIRVTVLEEEVVVAAPEMPRKTSSTPPADV
jgi:hypothetical protein